MISFKKFEEAIATMMGAVRERATALKRLQRVADRVDFGDSVNSFWKNLERIVRGETLDGMPLMPIDFDNHHSLHWAHEQFPADLAFTDSNISCRMRHQMTLHNLLAKAGFTLRMPEETLVLQALERLKINPSQEVSLDSAYLRMIDRYVACHKGMHANTIWLHSIDIES